MRAAAALLAVLALGLAGCGGGEGGERRDAVDAYFQDVNRVHRRFEPAFARANRTLQRYSRNGSATPREIRRLREAVSAMRAARSLLAGLEPPPDAARLHRDLLRLYDLDAALALELSQMAHYLPRVERALAPVRRASEQLRRELAAASTPGAQRAALAHYRDALEAVLLRLEFLAAPPVLHPWHEGQVARVRSARVTAGLLADGIRQEDRRTIDAALERFRALSSPNRSVGRAQADAIRAFNRRLRSSHALIGRIERERQRIAGEVA